MNITYDKLGPVEGVITIQIDEKDYADKVKKQLKEIGKTHAEKGFRVGHVPAGLIAKKYGKAVKYDVINKEVSDELVKYIEDNKIDVLGNPMPVKNDSFNLDDTEFTFKFNVGLAPEIKTVVNKDLKVPYYRIQVSEEMIDRQDESMRRQFGRQIPGEEVEPNSLVKGVLTELDETGAPKEGGIVQETGIVAPDYFKDEEQKKLFEGKKVGDAVIFNPWKTCDGNASEMMSMLNVEKDQVDDHKGDFEMNIREIIVFRPAELGQEYYDELFGKDKVHNEEEYRAAIKNMLEGRLVGDANYRFSIDAKDAIMAAEGDVTLPDAVLKEFLISQNETLNHENIDEEYEKARKDLEWEIIRGKILKDFGIKVDEADLKQTATMIARQQLAQYGMQNASDEMLEKFTENMLGDEKTRTQIANQALNMKLWQAVQNAVTLEEKEISVEDFNALFQQGEVLASEETED